MEICLLKVIFRHRLALQRRRRVLNEEKMSDVSYMVKHLTKKWYSLGERYTQKQINNGSLGTCHTSLQTHLLNKFAAAVADLSQLSE